MINLLLSLSGAFALLAASCTSSIGAFLTAPYTVWFPVVALAIVVVISILAVIYALSPFISTGGGLRTWTRVKIYELLMSMVLVIIFASFATILCTTDPTTSLSNAGLISSQCLSTGGSSGSANIYSVALCNLYQFNSYVLHLNQYLYYVQVIFAIQPSFAAKFKLGAQGVGSISASVAGLELAPVSLLSGSFAGGSLTNSADYMIPLLYTFVMLNQLQLLLLSAAPLLFAIFMAVGLIMRAFGITRTFGGAMIAFALGLGFVYPLLVAVNYGFINYALEHTISSLVTSASSVAGAGALTTLSIPTANPILFLISAVTTFTSGTSLLTSFPEYLFIYVGLVIVGIVFIDILNFVILDTFIIDFSQAVGERMSFLSILQNII